MIKTHGDSIKGSKFYSLYTTWKAIKQRCYNPKASNYIYYGGKGVSVCEEWRNNYSEFKQWALKNGYQKGLNIDKDILLKGNKIYSPTTCCFVSPRLNSQGKNRTYKTKNTPFPNIYMTRFGKFKGDQRVNGKRYMTKHFKTKVEAYRELLKQVKAGEKIYEDINCSGHSFCLSQGGRHDKTVQKGA